MQHKYFNIKIFHGFQVRLFSKHSLGGWSQYFWKLEIGTKKIGTCKLDQMENSENLVMHLENRNPGNSGVKKSRLH